MDSTVNRESDMGLAALPLSREQGQVEAGLEDGEGLQRPGILVCLLRCTLLSQPHK